MKHRTKLTILASAFRFLVAHGGISEATKHFNAGVELGEQGRHQEAISEYDEAIRLDREYAESYNGRGFAYDDLGQHERAIADLDEAIRLDPQDANPYYLRSLTHAWLGSAPAAHEDLERAVSLGADRSELESAILEIQRQG